MDTFIWLSLNDVLPHTHIEDIDGDGDCQKYESVGDIIKRVACEKVGVPYIPFACRFDLDNAKAEIVKMSKKGIKVKVTYTQLKEITVKWSEIKDIAPGGPLDDECPAETVEDIVILTALEKAKMPLSSQARVTAFSHRGITVIITPGPNY